MRGGFILAIWMKEVRDLLRDSKTLLFMLLLPTVLLPLLTLGIGRLAIHMVTRTAMQEVTVAADAGSRERYLQLAHEAFLRGEAGRMMASLQDSPMTRLMERLRPGTEAVPSAIFNDPEAFAQWSRGLAGLTREKSTELLSGGFPDAAALATPTPAATMAEELFDLAIRSVGMVSFVDPAFLVAEGAEGGGELPAWLRDHPSGEAIHSSLRGGRIDAWLVIAEDPAGLAEEAGRSVEVLLGIDSTNARSIEARSRIGRAVEGANRAIVERRLLHEGLDGGILHAVSLRPGTDLGTAHRQMLALLGGLLPYLVLVFAYMGGMYPAVDLGAGEKERYTLETLLLTPATRLEIALAKYLVIFFFSLTAAVLGIGSMLITVGFFLPRALLELIGAELSPMALVAAGVLAIPPAAAFSGIFLGISIYARSFREAQNYMSPLAVLLILPAAAGLLPGVEPTWRLALVPLVNVSLLCREAVKGAFDPLHYALTFGSCALLAAICIAWAVWQFGREKVLFRS